ncbi:MAG: hypothetical protein E6J41_12220 [Chloroflexi bacterium]|jgi:hypothetical protein|nr:MAG: hypothetical protein E6J41_12220 [Chloroflexota bacterium]
MSKFKRVSLAGSEELFRATATARPRVVEDEPTVEVTDAITEVVEHGNQRRVSLTPEEIELLLEAIHAAKYPERAKRPLPLEKFERYDALRDRLQKERQ